MSRAKVFNEFNASANVLYLKQTLYKFITTQTSIDYNTYMECFDGSLARFSATEKSRCESEFIDIVQAVRFLNLKFMSAHTDALMNRAPKRGTPNYVLSDGMIMSYGKAGLSADEKLKQWRDKPRSMAIYRDDTHGAVGQKSDVQSCKGARGIEMYSVSREGAVVGNADSWMGSGLDDEDAIDSRDEYDDDYSLGVLKEECNYGTMNTAMPARKLGVGMSDRDVFKKNELGQLNGFKQARVRMHRRMVERNVDEEINSVEYDVGERVRGFDMSGIKDKLCYRVDKRRALKGGSVDAWGKK